MSCYLKHETVTDAIALFTEGCGGDGKVGLSGEGTRVDERTARLSRLTLPRPTSRDAWHRCGPMPHTC